MHHSRTNQVATKAAMPLSTIAHRQRSGPLTTCRRIQFQPFNNGSYAFGTAIALFYTGRHTARHRLRRHPLFQTTHRYTALRKEHYSFTTPSKTYPIMASTSEAGFGARLARAEQLLTHLLTFEGYQPLRADDSPTILSDAIAAIKASNAGIAARKDSFAIAATRRRHLFFKGSNSVGKLLTPILATVRASFGKDSQEVANLSATAARIRSTQVSRKKSDDSEQHISQSERSYGSMTQTFADLLSQLTQMGPGYAPANPRIYLDILQALLGTIGTTNTEVITHYNQLKQLRDDRSIQYSNLRDQVQRIKESVKAQYGSKSTEYALVKGLKV